MRWRAACSQRAKLDKAGVSSESQNFVDVTQGPHTKHGSTEICYSSGVSMYLGLEPSNPLTRRRSTSIHSIWSPPSDKVEGSQANPW